MLQELEAENYISVTPNHYFQFITLGEEVIVNEAEGKEQKMQNKINCSCPIIFIL